MLYVTHDPLEAMTLADRLVLLNNGVLEQVGSPTELYEQPRNRFVASFLGWPRMSFFGGHLVGAAKGLCLVGSGGEVPLPAETVPTLAAHRGREVALGLRPEDFHLGGMPPSPTLVLEVGLVESLGPSRLVTLRCGSWQATVQVPALLAPPLGSTVAVGLDLTHAHYFDGRTGQTLAVRRKEERGTIDAER